LTCHPLPPSIPIPAASSNPVNLFIEKNFNMDKGVIYFSL
jgi:hypothetical protein